MCGVRVASWGSFPFLFGTAFAWESTAASASIGCSTCVAEPGRPRPGVGNALRAETARLVETNAMPNRIGSLPESDWGLAALDPSHPARDAPLARS